MITHIVLMQVASSVDKTRVNEVMQSLGDLRYSSIPQIKQFTYGENCSPEGLSKDFNYGFSMHFESVEDRDHYLHHPDHINIAKQVQAIVANGLDSIMVFDYTY